MVVQTYSRRLVWSVGAESEACVASDREGRKYGSINGNYVGELDATGTKPEGFGTLRRHGDEYTGQLKDGKPHGYGEMRYASGGRHQGCWVDGVAEGHGRLVDARGMCIHDGVFAKGMPTEGYNVAQSARVGLAVRKFIRNLG